MIKIIKAYIHLADNINKWTGNIFAFLLFPITFITVYEVFCRYVIKHPTIWAWDLNIQLFAAVIMLGGGYTLLEGGHISVDVFSSGFNPRVKASVDLFTSFFFFLGMIVIIKYGWEIAWNSFLRREAMATVWAPPLYPFRMLIPLGALLLLLQGLAKFFRDLFVLLKINTKEFQ